MNVLPSTSSMREPDARRMKSGAAPTDVNARTGLSTPPGRIAWARANMRAERAVFMSPDSNGREVAERGGDELDLVLVVRAPARRVERARRAVEVAVQQERGRDADRRAIRRGIAFERALIERARERQVVREQR